MTRKSLYQRLLDAGIPCSNWQSDLYFPATEQTRALVKQCLDEGVLAYRPDVFRSNVSGAWMFDAFGMFDPFWESRKG